ncbi:hypothetical protein M8C13_26970 [Crossiella sp. SN42]|uniref:hypothetical protein n=1 Tax=Crossiella sp. SN42 TaxID=2944808 RepID=UPI00207C2469|nr:hypothetical protein [Crossiella sp. SN42]MCO1579398.1 hypothetical protein [Crossiella sp. SN42]
MPGQRWVKVPIGPHSPQWTTVRTERTVLAVVHNLTAATRLLDLLPLVADDPRVQVVFTCPGSSPFSGRTEEWLHEREMAVIPWSQAIQVEFDLAISASYGGDLRDLLAPLVVVPHGMGYNKYSPGNRKSEIGNRKSVFGLSSRWLLSDGELIPSLIVLSHEEQLTRLAAAVPEAAERALVAGDPCFDRLLAGLPLRPSYRATLGVTDTQRLVLVCSTWGPDSLYGNDPQLIRRLLEALPLDDYRIVVALHPAVWDAHSRWQLHRWLAECTRAGAVVLPPEEGWRAATIAADLVIGDHSSLSFYAAALGRPVLLATAPAHAVDPDSAVGRFLATAPPLAADLRAAVDQAIATHDPATAAEVTSLATSAPGESAPLLRKAFYQLLALPEPSAPARLAAPPLPPAAPEPVAAQLVQVRLDLPKATVTRHPAELLRQQSVMPPGAHLAADTTEPYRAWLDLAEVVLHTHTPVTAAWVAATLAALPSCQVAAGPLDASSWLAGTRDGRLFRYLADGLTGRLAASVLRVAGDLPPELTIEVGGRTVQATRK